MTAADRVRDLLNDHRRKYVDRQDVEALLAEMNPQGPKAVEFAAQEALIVSKNGGIWSQYRYPCTVTVKMTPLQVVNLVTEMAKTWPEVRGTP